MKSKKNVLNTLFLFALLAVTAIVVVQANDITSVFAAVMSIDPVWLMLGILLALSCVAAEGVILWYLLRSMQAPVRMIRCILWSFIGFFFSGITPSTSGGQPAQMMQMKKEGIRISDSTLALLLVAILNKAVICSIGVSLALFWHSGLAQAFGGLLWLFYLCLTLNVAFIAVLALAIARPIIIMRLALGIEGMLISLRIWQPSPERQQKMQDMLAESEQALQYMMLNKEKVIIAAGITLLQRCGICLLTWLVTYGIGLHDISIPLVMALQAVVSIAVDLVPLPGAIGVSELVYSTVFTSLLTGSLLTASMLVTRGLSFYVPLFFSLLAVIYVRAEDGIADKRALSRREKDEISEEAIGQGREKMIVGA